MLVVNDDRSWAEYVNRFHLQYIRGFMWHDIKAAIDGKANFLAALGLVNYTEILGALSQGTLRNEGKPNRDKFEAFFQYMGQDYKDLLNNDPNIYRKLRNKLTHEYFAYTIGTIAMESSTPLLTGIILGTGGDVSIVVQRYFEDLQLGAERYFARLSESGYSSPISQDFRKCFPAGLIQVTR